MAKGISKLQELHDSVLNMRCDYSQGEHNPAPNTFYFFEDATETSPDDPDFQEHPVKKTWRCIYKADDETSFELNNIEQLEPQLRQKAAINPHDLLQYLAADNSMLQHLSELIAKKYAPSDLQSAIAQGVALMKIRFSKDYRLMSEAAKKAEKIQLLTFQLALTAQLQRTDMHKIRGEQNREAYQNLLHKSTVLLEDLDKGSHTVREKKSDNTNEQTLTNYLADRVTRPLPSEFSLREALLTTRKILTFLKGDSVNWAYSQNNSFLRASNAFVKNTDINPLGYDVRQVKANLEITKKFKRHSKHHLAFATFLIDAFLAGMDASEGAFAEPGKEPSFWDALNQLPENVQLSLKTGLIKNIIGSSKFWTFFANDKNTSIGSGINLDTFFNVVSVFGMVFQLGFMIQSVKTTLDKRDEKAEEVKHLKIALRKGGNPEKVLLLQSSLKQAEKELRALNAELHDKIASTFLMMAKIGLIVILMSFSGPTAPLVPVVMLIIDIAMDFMNIIVKQGLNIYEQKKEKQRLESSLHTALKELGTLRNTGEKQLLIKHILNLRLEIREADSAIDRLYFVLFRTLFLQLVVESIRTVVTSLLPFGLGTAMMGLTKITEYMIETFTDFMTEPEPVVETLPYTLEARSLDTLRTALAREDENGQTIPADQVLANNVLYVEMQGDNVHYMVLCKGKSVEGSFSLAELDITIDNMQDLANNLKPWLPDILAHTEARGHTDMLKQLKIQDDNHEKPVKAMQNPDSPRSLC